MIDDKLRISFSMKRRRVLIYRSTLRSIGVPQNIRFLLNTKRKCIAVQGCEAIDRDSFKVPDIDSGSKDQYEITSITFINMIYKLAGWNLDKTYRISGTAYPSNRLAEFFVGDAVEIQEDEFVDPDVEPDNKE